MFPEYSDQRRGKRKKQHNAFNQISDDLVSPASHTKCYTWYEKWDFRSSWVYTVMCLMLSNVQHIIRDRSQNVTLPIFQLLDE